ncbi:SMC-Scp complex subunit ScpB [Candidatus Pacearchaeota archaeon RBG_16_35_8]|nr:MAG: SMC-Scp complex subunit ScpB [Candidatus Pacearchaeota archaeon RBG_16_35_8]
MVTSTTIDEVDDAREKEDTRRLEAVFFVSGRFLNMQELVSLSDLNPVIIRNLIRRLQERYEKNDSAIEIVEKKTEEGEMWKMDVKREYHNVINKLATGSSEFSKAEQETLAIIAFKQPIKQSVIIKIRGNKAYDHIKKFAELGLVKKKKTGHTSELSLSDEFYDYFSVNEGSSMKEIEKKMDEEKMAKEEAKMSSAGVTKLEGK